MDSFTIIIAKIANIYILTIIIQLASTGEAIAAKSVSLIAAS